MFSLQSCLQGCVCAEEYVFVCVCLQAERREEKKEREKTDRIRQEDRQVEWDGKGTRLNLGWLSYGFRKNTSQCGSFHIV